MKKKDIKSCRSVGKRRLNLAGVCTDNRISPKCKNIIKMSLKAVFTIFMVMFITGVVAGVSIFAYIMTLTDNKIDYNVKDARLNLTSFVYVNDENGVPKEYESFHSSENRVWVDFNEIPKNMKDAMVAIEDKRFYKHKGVDWVRTTTAIINLATGGKTYGGSTLTQQLIKNLTEDNEASLTRKVREIFRALNFEKEYSKDEILEAYLNVVNFGSGCNGVQSAANLYFGKDIKDCSIAQCAAIAGITKNPSAYTPLVYPENNKIRRNIVINAMYDQNMITKDEYNKALEESENMKFVGHKNTSDNSISSDIRSWYTDALFNDVMEDLQNKLGIGKTAAESMIYTQGLKIYSAMDLRAQNIVESVVKDKSIMPTDPKLEMGCVMMGYDGRVLATLGSRKTKTGNLLYDRANQARRQPGSTIKPLAVYAPIIDAGMYNYSSLIKDEPLRGANVTSSGVAKDWPVNWYGGYKGRVTLQWAIEKSANAPVAQLLNELTPAKSYEFLTRKLGLTHLDSQDANSLAALATGGTHVGVTVREMAAAFTIFGNGGMYNKPFTYYYVEDRDGNIILDNRDNVGKRAISSETATIMNRALIKVVEGAEGTGRRARISGCKVYAKTGTTTDNHDSWFIGGTPYSLLGVWYGYDNPKHMTSTRYAVNTWKAMTTKYISGKKPMDYNYDPNVKELQYCKETGKLAREGVCGSTATGYYAPSNIPEVCDGAHAGFVMPLEPEVQDNSDVQDVPALEFINE